MSWSFTGQNVTSTELVTTETAPLSNMYNAPRQTRDGLLVCTLPADSSVVKTAGM